MVGNGSVDANGEWRWEPWTGPTPLRTLIIQTLKSNPNTAFSVSTFQSLETKKRHLILLLSSNLLTSPSHPKLPIPFHMHCTSRNID